MDLGARAPSPAESKEHKAESKDRKAEAAKVKAEEKTAAKEAKAAAKAAAKAKGAKAKAKAKAKGKAKAKAKTKAAAKKGEAKVKRKARATAESEADDAEAEELPQLWLDKVEKYKPSSNPEVEYAVLENRLHSNIWHAEKKIAQTRSGKSKEEAMDFASDCARRVKNCFRKLHGPKG
jgi:hypothetical protein